MIKEVSIKNKKTKRKTKNVATIILILSTVFTFLFWFLEQKYPAIYLYPVLVAFFEASMVGGVADLFAIHVLFKHPFGIKIPHTAIIPKNKNRIGHALSDFFRENFLSKEYVEENVKKFPVSEKIGQFIEKNKIEFSNKTIRIIVNFVKTIDENKIKEFLTKKSEVIINDLDIKKYLLLMLGNLKNKEQHYKIVNFALERLKIWLDNPINSEKVNKWIEDSIKSDGKGGVTLSGTIKSMFVGKQNLSLNVQELIEKLNSQEGAKIKEEINNGFSSLIEMIEDDVSVDETIIEIKQDLIKNGHIENLINRLLMQITEWVNNDIIKVDSKIRETINSMFENLSVNLQENTEWKDKIQEKAILYLPKIIVENGEKIDKYIVNYIENLDENEIARLINEKVGDDLQYIRINGSIVGGLVGLTIFFVKVLLLNFV